MGDILGYVTERVETNDGRTEATKGLVVTWWSDEDVGLLGRGGRQPEQGDDEWVLLGLGQVLG